MYCTRCGQQLDDNSAYCAHCGAPTDNCNTATCAAPAQPETNALAIVGFVLSFFVSLPGLICSIIGYRKAKNEGYGQRGLAIAGIVISSVTIGIVFLYVTFFISIIFGIYGGFLSAIFGFTYY